MKEFIVFFKSRDIFQLKPCNHLVLLVKFRALNHRNMVREAGIAQMVEQRTCNAKVPSSILGAGTTARNIGASGGVGEWLKPADCKSVAYGYAGSNPAPSTIF